MIIFVIIVASTKYLLKQLIFHPYQQKFLESYLVLSEVCTNRIVKEATTESRDSLSKYFAYHIFLSNSPAIRIALTKASCVCRPCVVYKAKTSYLQKIFFWACFDFKTIIQYKIIYLQILARLQVCHENEKDGNTVDNRSLNNFFF